MFLAAFCKRYDDDTPSDFTLVNLEHLVAAGNGDGTLYLKFLEGTTVTLPHCDFNTKALDKGTGFRLSHHLDQNRQGRQGPRGDRAEPKRARVPHPAERPASPAPVNTVVTPQPPPRPLEQPEE